jgi:hypothetical protein
MSAFLYLVSHSARNRLFYQLKRARNPRYGIALVVAVFYIWAFLIRPSRVALGEIFLNRPGETIATLLLVITLSGAWVFGSDTLALAFTEAELALLFPAPLSRRALIGYKLYRAQVAVVVNALIWVFVLRRGGTALPAPLRALGIWMLFSTLSLHRLAAALVRSSWREHGRSGAKRNLWSIVAFSVVAALLIAGAALDLAKLRLAGDVGNFFIILSDVFSRPPASIALFPFRLIVAPTFATSVRAWTLAMLPALAMLLVHVIWIFRVDRAFEDAAIEASVERARRSDAARSRRASTRLSTPTKAVGTIRLATAGHPALAIVWKNMLCLRRTMELRVLIAPAVMAIVLGMAVSDGARDPALFVAAVAVAFGAMLLIFGGRLIRNDLRHDMLHLPMLKTLPISAWHLVVAEVASSAMPMAVIQLALVGVAFVASLSAGGVTIPLGTRVGMLVGAPFAMVALNGALLTIQNGLAVLFPAWMRLGATVNTGVEALGQNLISTMANLFSLAFALLVPVGVGYFSIRYLDLRGPVAVAAMIIFVSGVLALETYAVIRYVGRALAAAEPVPT